MPYTPLPHVTTGDLATAALQNTQLDNIASIYAGGIAVTSQATDDFILASSSTQFTRRGSGDQKVWNEMFS